MSKSLMTLVQLDRVLMTLIDDSFNGRTILTDGFNGRTILTVSRKLLQSAKSTAPTSLLVSD